jgi:ATPase subunit of ABC transporter with duplicated ATPase domains
MAKSISIDNLSIIFGAIVILNNTKLTIAPKQHYGLIGRNGSGKTSLLNYINEIPNLDIIYVKQEGININNTVMETIMSADIVMYEKMKRYQQIQNPTNDQLEEYQELGQEINVFNKNIAKIHKILHGLGFANDDHLKMLSTFSGGWQMKIILARALFITPNILILDEPTNHLDLNATLWLCEYLKSYPNTFIVVSHDKYFLNEICSTIINIEQKQLNYYKGNIKLMEKQIKAERKQQEKEYKKYLKSGNKVCKRKDEYVVSIDFVQPAEIKGTLLKLENVSFKYENCQIFNNLNLEITKKRMALVGPNGAGKSTLLKLLSGHLLPSSGTILRHPTLRIGYYDQHFTDTMPFDMNAIEYLRSLNTNLDLTSTHKLLSSFGIEPEHRKTLINKLSGGQKSRVKLASFTITKPHILILDEPSNHLDMQTLDGFIIGLNAFDGAIIIVTHNFDLITETNCELWTITNKTIEHYDNYEDYIETIKQ